MTHLDNLHPQLIIIWVAPLVEAEPLGVAPVYSSRLQMLLGYSQPQLHNTRNKLMNSIRSHDRELIRSSKNLLKGFRLHLSQWMFILKKTKLRDLSPRANYTDRATAACWQS
jgi:hypothetical protein